MGEPQQHQQHRANQRRSRHSNGPKASPKSSSTPKYVRGLNPARDETNALILRMLRASSLNEPVTGHRLIEHYEDWNLMYKRMDAGFISEHAAADIYVRSFPPELGVPLMIAFQSAHDRTWDTMAPIVYNGAICARGDRLMSRPQMRTLMREYLRNPEDDSFPDRPCVRAGVQCRLCGCGCHSTKRCHEIPWHAAARRAGVEARKAAEREAAAQKAVEERLGALAVTSGVPVPVSA